MGTGNIIEAVRHQRMVSTMIRRVTEMDDDELSELSEEYIQSYIDAYKILTNQEVITEDTMIFGNYTYETVKEEVFEILKEIQKINRLPVVNFAAGGVATPADAAIMMQLGSDGVFVGSGIFKSENPAERAKAIVEAVTHYDDSKVIAEVSKNLGEAMRGVEIENLTQHLQERGW